MLVPIISIIGLTLVFWILWKVKLFKFCPICAAVVLTWAGLVVWMLLGRNVDQIVLATLVGMSIGATATKYDLNLIWKTGIVIFGLLAVWHLLNGNTSYSAVFLGAIILLTVASIIIKPSKNKAKGSEKDKFEDCCN